MESVPQCKRNLRRYDGKDLLKRRFQAWGRPRPKRVRELWMVRVVSRYKEVPELCI